MASKDQKTYKRQEESKNQKSDNRDIIRKIMSEESSDIQVKNTQKRGEPSRNQSNFKEQQDQEQKRRDNKFQPSSQRTASSGNQQREDSSKKIHQGQHSSGYDLQQGTGTCFNHGKPFSDYCESCEEPCCEDCKNFGHRVVPISEAYRKRMSQMYSMMNTHLYQKKETLIQQVKKREQLIEEVKNASLSIERELRAEFSGMIERLNAQAGQKLALLQYDKDELQSDVNRIQEIAIQIDQSSSDHLQFLMKSKNIMDSMESAHAKPYRTEIKVTVDDLPKELFQTKELVQQCALYKELNATKDELIWRLLQVSKTSSKMTPTVQQELNEWAKLTEKYSEALNKLNLKCFYCQVNMDENSVNSICKKNTQIDVSVNFPSHLVGNGRHNFMQANKAAPIQEEEIYKEIRQQSSTLNINLEVMFKDFDNPLPGNNSNIGYINLTDFCYLLYQYFQVSQQQAELIAENLFPEPNMKHLVDYNAFIRKLYLSTTKPLLNENFQNHSSDEDIFEQPKKQEKYIPRIKESEQSKKQIVKDQKQRENVKEQKYIREQSREKERTQEKDQNQQGNKLKFSQERELSSERKRKTNEEEKQNTKSKNPPEEQFEKKLKEKYLSKEKQFKQEISIFLDEEGLCSVENLKVALYKTNLGLTNQEILKASQLIAAKDGKILCKDFMNLFH